MAKTVYIGDDREMKVLFCEQDFVNLIWERLGRDAGMHLEDMLLLNKQELEDAYERGRLAGLDECDDGTAYDNGREDGYEDGYSDGYGKGYSEGFEAGYKKHNPWA